MRRPQVIIFPKSKIHQLQEDGAGKSCANCRHSVKPNKSAGEQLYRCLQYPNANLTEINNNICKVGERKYWAPIQQGLIGRFIRWLF